MRLTYFLIIGVTCISCNSRSNKTRVESMDDTARKVTDVNKVISINPLKITGADLSSLKYKGKLQEAWKWNDNLGENIFFTTYVAPYADSGKSQFDEEGQTSELHAFHYSKKGDSYTPVWTFSDGVQACEFDITSNFIPGSTTITDLDNDGIAEIKIQYLTACRSDVSPAAMKLVLYENGQRHILKGLSWLPYSSDLQFELNESNLNLEKLPAAPGEEDEHVRSFGRYENEKEFSTASPQLLQYARREWLKFVKEKIGE